jgi:L-lactate dehydrogenase complex protein LldG
MSSREAVLRKVRTALGRSAGQGVPPAPLPLIRIPAMEMEQRIERFNAAWEKLNGKAYRAASLGEARGCAERVLAGRSAVASNAPFLAECGITTLPGVVSGFTDRLKLREACLHLEVGITSADCALADTGTLVMFSSREEARMISLLPPCHLAVVPRDRILTSLDELLTLIPVPSDRSSSMVLITGPSRTADIEQILVRGVHGPGEVHAIVV